MVKVSDLLDAMNEGILPTRPLVTGTGSSLVDKYLDQQVSKVIKRMPAGELADWMLRHAPPVSEHPTELSRFGVNVSSSSISPNSGYRATVYDDSSAFTASWDFDATGGSLVGSAYQATDSGPEYSPRTWSKQYIQTVVLDCGTNSGSGLYAMLQYSNSIGQNYVSWHRYSSGIAPQTNPIMSGSFLNYYTLLLNESHAWYPMAGPPTCGSQDFVDTEVYVREGFPSADAILRYKTINGEKYYTFLTVSDTDARSMIQPDGFDTVYATRTPITESEPFVLFGDVSPPEWYLNHVVGSS